MVLALYFFLLDGPKMIKTCQQLSPLDDVHEQELVDEFGPVSYTHLTLPTIYSV